MSQLRFREGVSEKVYNIAMTKDPHRREELLSLGYKEVLVKPVSSFYFTRFREATTLLFFILIQGGVILSSEKRPRYLQIYTAQKDMRRSPLCRALRFISFEQLPVSIHARMYRVAGEKRADLKLV